MERPPNKEPNKEHLAILRMENVAAWNHWRQENRQIPHLWGADLESADLPCINLSRAVLYGANLRRANLNKADLTNANLRFANLDQTHLFSATLKKASLCNAIGNLAYLCDADLGDANLFSAHFTSVYLNNTNLIGANLTNANFHNVDFEGADLGNAIISNTEFANCDLSMVNGLNLVRHEGPSTIGLDTIYKSKGKIPDSFLRGCGVPESFIAQMRSLVGAEDGIQFYSCFISYSNKDEEFAQRLHGKMRDGRLRVWFAPEDIQGGKKLHEQIETAIRLYDKLLIVLSDASLHSEWVMDELRKGFKAERDSGKRKLFPVRVTDYETLVRWECRDSLSGKDLAEEVRQYFIPDFSNWKTHDAFEVSFARLLKDLRAEQRLA